MDDEWQSSRQVGSVDPRSGNQEMALRNKQSLKAADRSTLVESCQGLKEKLLKRPREDHGVASWKELRL